MSTVPPNSAPDASDKYVRTRTKHTFSTTGSEIVEIESSDGQYVRAELTTDERLLFEIRGYSRKGEEGASRSAWILVERLNQYGSHWGEPEYPASEREEGVDLIAKDGQHTLRIQVTRALTDADVWTRLRREGVASGEVPVDRACSDLMEAVRTKTARIPRKQRADIILALDAVEPAIHSPLQFAVAFRRRHATECVNLGFQGIWLVGPTAALTQRIDRIVPSGPVCLTD
jgi:hypothetical protein